MGMKGFGRVQEGICWGKGYFEIFSKRVWEGSGRFERE